MNDDSAIQTARTNKDWPTSKPWDRTTSFHNATSCLICAHHYTTYALQLYRISG